MSKQLFILILMLGSLTACGGGGSHVETDRSDPMNTGGSFYNIGKNAAESTAMSAWDNLDRDCQQIPSFVQIIEDSMDDVVADLGTKYQGQSAKDFGSGYLDGLSNVLDDVRGKCQEPSLITQIDQLEQFCRSKF